LVTTACLNKELAQRLLMILFFVFFLICIGCLLLPAKGESCPKPMGAAFFVMVARIFGAYVGWA
jgi:hypothetical protein